MVGTEFFIAVLSFAAIFLFGLGIYFYNNYYQERKAFLKRIEQAGEEIPSQEQSLARQADKNLLFKILESVGIAIHPKGEEEISLLRQTFLKAGYRKENAPVIFYGIKALSAILFFSLFFVAKLFLWRTLASIPFMFYSILMALIGFYLPNLWLKTRINRRRARIQEGLPDALDLMVVCVEAGTGLDAAINRIGEEMKLANKTLSEEFRILSLELRAGKQRKDALKNLSLRADLEDVSSLVTLLIQTEKFGTSIAQALRVYSDSMRTKRFQRAEEIAAKLPIKLIFPLLLFIFPALLVVILGPAVISIFRTLIQQGIGR